MGTLEGVFGGDNSMPTRGRAYAGIHLGASKKAVFGRNNVYTNTYYMCKCGSSLTSSWAYAQSLCQVVP